MASQHNFPQISSMDDIIIHIYKFLEFGDQLRLSRVNSQLKIIFKSYIWKEEYASLKIYKHTHNFVITNGKCDNWLYLKPEEYQEFLQTYADDVLELTIQNPEYAETMEHNEDLNYFQNLLSFKYEQAKIPVDDVKVITERNTNLQELTLIGQSFQYETDDELIKCILLKMLNLKRLRIKTYSMLKIKLSQFQEILSISKLESLNLNALIALDERLKESEKTVTMPIGLTEFAITTEFDHLKWPSDSTSYFRNFKCLTALTINHTRFTDSILATIAETCNCLKEMQFAWSYFHEVLLFRVPFSVVEFTLLYCYGLSHENLKQILSLHNITKVHSTHTQYEGEFEDFDISSLIETLHIRGDFPTLKFKSAYTANKNLKELTWYDDSLTYMTPSFPLKHCINLHTLNLLGCQMNLDTLLELKSLRKLEIPYTDPQIQWSVMTQLLQQHSSLRELIIKTHEFFDTEYSQMDLPAPNKGFATQVCSLEIPFDMLVLALDFWLDLFAQNKSLMLICWSDQPHEWVGEVIQDIVNHTNFPKTMKTIDVCGFQTDCKFIRNQYEDFLKRIEIQIEIFSFMSEYDKLRYFSEDLRKRCMEEDEKYPITLYRK